MIVLLYNQFYGMNILRAVLTIGVSEYRVSRIPGYWIPIRDNENSIVDVIPLLME